MVNRRSLILQTRLSTQSSAFPSSVLSDVLTLTRSLGFCDSIWKCTWQQGKRGEGSIYYLRVKFLIVSTPKFILYKIINWLKVVQRIITLWCNNIIIWKFDISFWYHVKSEQFYFLFSLKSFAHFSSHSFYYF